MKQPIQTPLRDFLHPARDEILMPFYSTLFVNVIAALTIFAKGYPTVKKCNFFFFYQKK